MTQFNCQAGLDYGAAMQRHDEYDWVKTLPYGVTVCSSPFIPFASTEWGRKVNSSHLDHQEETTMRQTDAKVSVCRHNIT